MKHMESVILNKALDSIDADTRYGKYRELWKKAEQFELLTDYPLHLDIELSAVCNMKCRFCFQNGLLKGPLGFMPVELFKKIIDEGKERGLCAAKLQVRGESFLHPQLFECISYAKAAGIMDLQITTNATLLTEDNYDPLLDSGLDGLIVSYDHHHKESPGDSYDFRRVETNIQQFLEHREAVGSTTPWVRIQASIEDGEPEIIKAEIRQKFPEAECIAVNRIHAFDYKEEAYPDLLKNYDLLPCNYPMQRLTVYWNGDVTVCCMDYNNRFNFGNVNQQSIHEIWNSAKFLGFRESHTGKLRSELPICNRCLVAIKPKGGQVNE